MYDPDTGKFFNQITRNNKGASAGTEAGCIRSDGYVTISIDRTIYLAHRLAWLYVHGYMPENDLDHIDQDPSNNQISNLREVSRSCNAQNSGNPKDNTSGVKGIYWHKQVGKWHVQITTNRRKAYLGIYDDFDDAVCARLAAEQCLNWGGCDSSSPAYQHVQKWRR